MMTFGIGILGLGMCLPEERRSNDWWPVRVVDQWRVNAARQARVGEQLSPKTLGEATVLQCMGEHSQDPFQGAVERRIIGRDQVAADMEIAAALEAMSNARVDASGIDVVLTYSPVPEVLGTNQACTVHEALGFPASCFTLSVDGSCNSFLQQLEIAWGLIESGRARRALLVQSCVASRLMPYEEPFSAWFGDGAAAVVLGSVSPQRGLVNISHLTDGSLQNSLVATVPGARWYESGRVVMHTLNPLRAHRLFLESADTAKETIDSALERANLSPADVQFFACHQGTAWIRKAIQSYAGLAHATTLDTFPWAGSLSAANIPLVLYTAAAEGMLREGDLTVMYSGGSGITSSAAVVRWGS